VKLFRRGRHWWFRSKDRQMEYGPFTLTEGRAMLRQYRRFLDAADVHNRSK